MDKKQQKLVKLIEKYHKLIENEDFDGIDKLCEDRDILTACQDLATEIGATTFETKGFDSPGYDIQSYVFVWTDDFGKVEGVVLNKESF